MNVLIEYIALKAPQIILVFLQNVILQMLLLNIQFTLMDTKAPLKRQLRCASLISLIYLAPMYIIDCAFFYPGYLPSSLYTMIIFDNPISAVLYYFIIKKAFSYSATRSSIMLRNQLIMHFIVVLVYLFLFSSLVSFTGIREISTGIYLQDLLAIAVVMILLCACWFVFKFALKRNRKYIVIPPNYFEKNVHLQVSLTIFTVSVIYALMVVFRIHWLSVTKDAVSLSTFLTYVLLVSVLVLYLLNTISNLKKKLLDWELQATGTYISSLLNANQEFRRIKHDFYNMLQGYGGYLTVEDYDGLRKYHQKLFHTTRSAGDFLSLIDVLKSRIAVYSLFETKADKAESLKVDFTINQVCDITYVILEDIDLLRTLGIALDNAIEAAAMSDEKQVNISFEKKDEQTIVFIISNTTASNVDVRHIFDEGFTTKEGHTGIGLTEVMHILNSYEHCSYRAIYHDKQFSLFLILHVGAA